MDEIAATLAEVVGRDILFENETVEEAYASRAHYGAPAFEVDGWVSTYTAIANGETGGISGDIAAVTGREPQSFREFLSANPDSWAHLEKYAG